MNTAESVTQLAAYLRGMQLYYHHVHHHISGTAFFSDHEFAAGSYAAAEGAFDSVAERIIGNYGCETLELVPLVTKATSFLKKAPGTEASPEEMLHYALRMEVSLVALTEKLCKGADEADKQLFSTIGDVSKVRIYKLKRRLDHVLAK